MRDEIVIVKRRTGETVRFKTAAQAALFMWGRRGVCYDVYVRAYGLSNDVDEMAAHLQHLQDLGRLESARRHSQPTREAGQTPGSGSAQRRAGD